MLRASAAQKSPDAYMLLCAEELSTATTPTSRDAALDGHERAASAECPASGKRVRPIEDDCGNPDCTECQAEEGRVTSPLRKQRRVAGTPEKHAKEIKQVLAAEGRPASAGIMLGVTPARREMTQAQIDRFRDIGLALIVMVSNSFDVSARTFVLAVKIFDAFLKGVVVLPAPGDAPEHARSRGQFLSPVPAPPHQYEIPVACFIISCKFCETFAPRLTDTVAVIERKCTVEALRGAEDKVLEALSWDVNLLTGAAPATRSPRQHASCGNVPIPRVCLAADARAHFLYSQGLT